MPPLNWLELGAIYRLPSGRFAILVEQSSEGCLFHTVDVHRVREVPDGQLTLSPAASNRCRLAWHPHQWAQRKQERQALEERRAADLARWNTEASHATAK